MKILITGITGQDGRLLAGYLLNKGHEVHGLLRPRTRNFPHIDGVDLRYIDVTDYEGLSALFRGNQYDEVYNLAAQSHVGESFKAPTYTMMVNAVGAMNILSLCEGIPVYQASTSEMYGDERNADGRISESTKMVPNSPYGIAKLAAHNAVRVSRLRGNPHYAGILFNHESALRGDEFVTKKVTNYVRSNMKNPLELGNIYPQRDWGSAREYVDAMVKILRAQKDDYVVATGESYSVQTWVNVCFTHIGENLEWDGSIAYDSKGDVRVRGNTGKHNRPVEVDRLCGDPTRIERELDWTAKTGLAELAAEMIENNDAVNSFW